MSPNPRWGSTSPIPRAVVVTAVAARLALAACDARAVEPDVEPPFERIERLLESERLDEALELALGAGTTGEAGAAARGRLLAGRIESRRHRNAAAVGHLLRAATAAERAADPALLREIVEETGTLALVSGRPGLAVDSLRRNLKLVEATRAEPLRGRAHGLLGIALQKVGDYEGALARYAAAAEVYRENGIVVGRIASLLNMGTVQGEWLARYDDAVHTFERALELAENHADAPLELRGVLFLNLAEALSDSGRPDAALPLVERAEEIFVEIGHRQLQARAAVTTSKIDLLRGDPVAATTCGRRALVLARQVGDLDSRRLAHLAIGRALATLGRERESLRALQLAVDALESMRAEIGLEEMQISFLRDKRRTYEALIELLRGMDQADPRGGWASKALLASEASRSRSFLDHLPRAGGRREAHRPLGLEATRELLDEGEVLLEFFVGERGGYLLVVSAGQLHFIDLGPASELADRVAFVAGSLRADEAPEGPALSRLRATLLEGPLEALAPSSLVVVPDGPLFDLPFSVLLDAAGPAVSYVPSISVLDRARAAGGVQAERLLSVGVREPSSRGRPVPPLPLAGREAAEAGRWFARPTVVGPSATEAAVRAALDGASFEVVHFATHTWVDPEDPGAGGLLLSAAGGGQAAGENDDGLLSVREIAQLEIGSNLVVLSGCGTLGSETAPGEGVLGLTRSFLRAGVASMLVTLWEVSDSTSYEVTRRFYEEVARGHPLARALARAQRRLADLPDARAFILVGDGSLRLEGLRRPGPGGRVPVAAALVAAGLLLGIGALLRRRGGGPAGREERTGRTTSGRGLG